MSTKRFAIVQLLILAVLAGCIWGICRLITTSPTPIFIEKGTLMVTFTGLSIMVAFAVGVVQAVVMATLAVAFQRIRALEKDLALTQSALNVANNAAANP